MKFDRRKMEEMDRWSLPSRGAWIEIATASTAPSFLRGRSPHGERGLKFFCISQAAEIPLSLPSRGAWIEIYIRLLFMKFSRGRSPHGERGLKYRYSHLLVWSCASLPSRGAWIEILAGSYDKDSRRSLPSRGAWIEIVAARAHKTGIARRSPHGERGLK